MFNIYLVINRYRGFSGNIPQRVERRFDPPKQCAVLFLPITAFIYHWNKTENEAHGLQQSGEDSNRSPYVLEMSTIQKG